MQAAVEILKRSLSRALVALLLVEVGCQQLCAASALGVQHTRAALPPNQVRVALTPLLIAAVESFRESLAFDDTRFQVHYLTGQVAYRLLGDARLAFVHLQQAEYLAPSGYVLADDVLGQASLEAGQVFAAKRFFFTLWQSGRSDDQARQALCKVLPKEEEVLRHFSQDEGTRESTIPYEETGAADRAEMLNHVVAQVVHKLASDQETRVRTLWRRLKQALVNNDHSVIDELEKALLAEIGPLLLAE
jgi:hypothetical protein